ncbi:MAG: trypsin-like peptidase domain-containing protein [Chloroflexi bacterium]|nr:trypsin-like peptidase domain-containing protein [Chloroflexota bacterium]
MVGILPSLSDDLAAAVASGDPGVVRVEARRRLPASGVVWSSDGMIVTTHHAVERDENILIGPAVGETVPATLIGRDPSTDLAVLHAQVSGLEPPTWSEPDSLQVGHLVLALGRPGRSTQATLGIASALGESWRTPMGGRVDRYIQSDVAMYPGFSGGPLIDAGGNAVGINTTALHRGITLTIPVSTIRTVVDALVAHGRIRRGYLGIGVQPARLSATLTEHLGQETGLLVVSVESDSPAERAGLLLGDTAITLEGQPLRYPDDLLALLSGDRIGDAVSVRIVRGGQVQEVKATIGERA